MNYRKDSPATSRSLDTNQGLVISFGRVNVKKEDKIYIYIKVHADQF
jgi:hypothetical protein